MFFPNSRIVTLVGHYGSGKSELAINLALLFAATKDCTFETEMTNASKVRLVDLDIVNPYFRSREVADFLLQRNIEVLCSAEDFPGVDLPYMPGNIAKIFQDESAYAVIDAGGDPAGARVLARYSDEISKAKSEVYFVINGNRPQTKNSESTVKYMNDIQGASGLRITGIINNTHLLDKTEPEDVLEGSRLVGEVSQMTGIPVIAHAVCRSLIDVSELAELEELDKEKILYINLHLRKPWEIA